MKLRNAKLEEFVQEFVEQIDYDIYKNIFVDPEDEIAEDVGQDLYDTMRTFLEDHGVTVFDEEDDE